MTSWHERAGNDTADSKEPRGPEDPERVGAEWLGGSRVRFRVWAPESQKVEVRLLGPPDRLETLPREASGYHSASVDGVSPGDLYRFRLDGDRELSDPASRSQPQGVHGPSQVVDLGQAGADAAGWRGMPLRDYLIYELHVGTFTREGTFRAAAEALPRLAELGVTAVELMPVAQFAGDRNWGYDGVFPFAAQDSYGGPVELKRLVHACHRLGMAAVLDVVYNHLGPEGNLLSAFGPYFNPAHATPWGPSVNFDGPDSDEVRRYFIENALYWLGDVGFDGLRLDALDAIVDRSAVPFLADLSRSVRALARKSGRHIHLIGESDSNDVRPLLPVESGGCGLDAQWNDDFHHSLHALLTDESTGYYASFGSSRHFALAYRDGFVYGDRYSPYRRRRHGGDSSLLPRTSFVVYDQSHDQVGNRMRGERLSTLVSFEALKLAMGAVLLSPFVPMLFMGEEYAETNPFPYFTSHSDPELAEAVRRGRCDEFASFCWTGDVPDPQDRDIFEAAKIDPEKSEGEPHRTMLAYVKELIRLRRVLPALSGRRPLDTETEASQHDPLVRVVRKGPAQVAVMGFNFGPQPAVLCLPKTNGEWRLELDSSDAGWGGPGPGARGAGAAARTPERAQPVGSISMAPRSLVLLTAPDLA